MTRHYDGPPRTQQEVKRFNEALLDAFYALGLSRYTSLAAWSGRQTQGKMRANRAAHERYAQAHYPVWTHPEMLRHLWAARIGVHRQPAVSRPSIRAVPRQL